ncbi:TPA: Myrrcad domain-containing protein [Candidatus Avigastranaerophilus faecigallinarum]|nr:Myrrcad domain-containing protein [Candidatus Avigastranaerophilus faecigallinarum]
MSKKSIVLFIIMFIFFQHSFSYGNQSLNTFQINVNDVPVVNNEKDSNLSDGAITAIVLGSTFAGLGILSGIGYYFYKNLKNLTCGLVCGQKCPYQTIDCKAFLEILASKKKYTYLMKASEKSVVNSDYYYLIIPDTEIKQKTFNTVFFELPKNNDENINFRIIQASKPYEINKKLPTLDSDIFLDPQNNNVKKVPTYTKELDSKDGYLIKSGTIQNRQSNIATITTQNLSDENAQTYAVIVEFWY